MNVVQCDAQGALEWLMPAVRPRLVPMVECIGIGNDVGERAY